MKKIIFAIVFAVFSLVSVSGASVCEAAENEAMLGFVNYEFVLRNYPGVDEVQKNLQEAQKALQAEFDAKAPELDEAAKAALQRNLSVELAKKHAEIMKPVQERIAKAVAAAAKKKGIRQVVKIEAMLYGGVDLTRDVIEVLKE